MATDPSSHDDPSGPPLHPDEDTTGAQAPGTWKFARVYCELGCRTGVAPCANQPWCEEDAKDPLLFIERLLPAYVVRDRRGWAKDLHASFKAHHVRINLENVGAAIAVIDQASRFIDDPVEHDLPCRALLTLEERARRAGVSRLLLGCLLRRRTRAGTYRERIENVWSEKELSGILDDFLGSSSFVRKLPHPVSSRGPMQVDVAFAERFVREHAIEAPYSRRDLAQQLFSRRVGLYFGVAKLLRHPAPYGALYRFGDYATEPFVSRNAAFQHAVAALSGEPLALEGMASGLGPTEHAIQMLAGKLNMGAHKIREDLATHRTEAFERTLLYMGVFHLAEKKGRQVPRALLPRIDLRTLKHPQGLSTEAYAQQLHEGFVRWYRRLAAPRPGGDQPEREA